LPSVIIAAHNEESVIEACLDALMVGRTPGDLEIVVSANGCTDRTATAAARPGVTVIDRPEPGKAAALNAGDGAVSSFPRAYLDADIVVPPGGLDALMQKAASPDAVAAYIPRRRIDTRGRPWPVRAYFAINERLPVFRTGLFGRGLIVLSQSGRARFGAFPEVIADDLFLDSQFRDEEKQEVPDVVVSVQAPFTTRDLIGRLVRVRRGNTDLRTRVDKVRPSDRWAWLRDVVIPHPWLAPAAVPYVVITLIAEIRSRRPAAADGRWVRDESTRGAR